MKLSNCKLIRIRDNNNYNMDVDKFIKSVEVQYKIDFRSLPNWKLLIKRLHVMTTDCKRRIRDANIRKSQIIEKLFVEWNKPLTFDLTDSLTRTTTTWQKNLERKKRPMLLKSKPQLIPKLSTSPELSGERSETAHPNTEIVLSENILLDEYSNTMIAVPNIQIEQKKSEIPDTNLPIVICTNQHKLLSSIGSQYSALSHITLPNELNTTLPTEYKEWLTLKNTSVLKSSPDEIRITNRSLNKQTVQFMLTNCTTEYLLIRFMCLTDKCWFKMTQLKPIYPLKLYPGMSARYTFTFKLSQTDEDVINTYLFFKVCRNVLNEAPTEVLLIPIVSQFRKYTVTCTEIVRIPPAYAWQIKYGHPVGVLKIITTDDRFYTLHVVKRDVDLARDSSKSLLSLEPVAPNSESLEERIKDQEVVVLSKIWASSKGEYLDDDVQSIKTIDVITSILQEIVEMSLETFFFDSTYLTIKPHTEYKILVHFPKPEHVGFHQCSYDLEFCEPLTEKGLITQTIKVFAEVLPHPIQIYPHLLDMSNSPVNHGFYEDRIIITNSHKLFPVTIKFKLTTKMKRLFTITPMETVVLPKSNIRCRIMLCSRKAILMKCLDELVHFTIKIIIIGDKTVYNKVPPFFYEIIAPCAANFKKIYNDKYFRNIRRLDDSNIDDM
ncbi:hypothetical protein K1T71_010294 [Dendrolimus kikuchii]|uniref:Uncharacterized protein n=1 Tax=Dendrolimus kikuchii TaxID=765133 RepID=A0ACC1CRG5_9NEOP|nr:hypothetical protein K1T71_010294 [Dendrolimus kikuchii]